MTRNPRRFYSPSYSSKNASGPPLSIQRWDGGTHLLLHDSTARKVNEQETVFARPWALLRRSHHNEVVITLPMRKAGMYGHFHVMLDLSLSSVSDVDGGSAAHEGKVEIIGGKVPHHRSPFPPFHWKMGSTASMSTTCPLSMDCLSMISDSGYTATSCLPVRATTRNAPRGSSRWKDNFFYRPALQARAVQMSRAICPRTPAGARSR